MKPEDDYRPTLARAFPTAHADFSGMTLRDYFAAAALTGSLSNEFISTAAAESGTPHDAFRMAISKAAYAFADAMLKEREK